MHAWEAVKNAGTWEHYDWTVKVDPDAVVIPLRLRRHLAEHAGKNVYIVNCHKPNGMKPMMFGSVEALSHKAVTEYFASQSSCIGMNWTGWGEDLFMGKCLQRLGIQGEPDLTLVSDGVCLGVNCSNATAAAFHPLKNLTSWTKCWREAEGK